MLVHYDFTRTEDLENIGHSVAVSFKDFSVWCFSCDRFVYEICFFEIVLFSMILVFVVSDEIDNLTD